MMLLKSGRDGKGSQKLRKFIAPGKLAKGRGSVLKSFRTVGTSNGGITSHNLVMHFGAAEYKEMDFSQDSCLLDILTICKRFIDIYSIGVKITDGDGRPLKSDQDVMAMLKEHEDVLNIHVYLEKDETAEPLSFKMPRDNPNLASYLPPIPSVTNVKILGDLKANKKVLVCGDVLQEIERSSTAQLFITISKNLDVENGFKAISESKTEKANIL